MCSVCGGRRAAGASPIRCVGERITATGVPEFREVAWRACVFLKSLQTRALNYSSLQSGAFDFQVSGYWKIKL
ncbi:hypothetical protein [Bathymodiolus japonicus methanotrophic gill symbiont]|uniref:hypothetical protein n=1 Tax=Bathymodiolus japonicus methanotrophic gill symbiont TaxID=113269 RepID=UPI001C8EEF87|nr:hypothetical protein [Bathymodiolus japonicus methanotrophic gill symbiont]